MTRDEVALQFMLRLVPTLTVPNNVAAHAYALADAYLAQKNLATSLTPPATPSPDAAPRVRRSASGIDLTLADEIPF